jgi:hypothetical protein
LPSLDLAEKYITSFMTYVPFFTRVAELDRKRTRREQLVKRMTSFQRQYTVWFSKQSLPFALVLDPASPQVNPNPYIPNVTNVGVVDSYIPRCMPSVLNCKVEIHDMKFGHRLVTSGRA